MLRDIENIMNYSNDILLVEAIDNDYKLLVAASSDDYHEVKKLLGNGVKDIDKQYNYKYTALAYAMRNGNIDIVQLLLEHGASVDVKYCYSGNILNALMEGVIYRYNTRIIELLLEYVVDINTQDDHGRTALVWAAGYNSTKMVELLLMYGIDPDIVCCCNSTAITDKSRGPRIDEIKILLKYNADINIRDNRGGSALSYMHGNNNAEIRRIADKYNYSEL